MLRRILGSAAGQRRFNIIAGSLLVGAAIWALSVDWLK
jgi:hypothetical protein